ncbi:MAG: hypothetical protein WC724_03095 [Candidatus Paceibacterota bacterium]|jgi:hypothetical protein
MNNKFSSWKTITIGNYKNTDELKEDILKLGFRIGDWANDILNDPSFDLASKEIKIDLICITVGELGFKNGAYLKEIQDRALSLGLKYCPMEVGPQLRRQYIDQPRLESLQIGMQSQVDSKGHKSEFRVVHGVDGFMWLVGDHKHQDNFWEEGEQFIFVK